MGARISSVWERLDGQEPAVTPSGFLTQFEAAVVELGFDEEVVPALPAEEGS